MPDNLETEAKFICLEEITKEHIANFVQAMRIVIKWNNIIHNDDKYWDTNDHQLLKSDISLRFRKLTSENYNKQADKFIGTLKLPKRRNGVILERYEMEWDIKASPEDNYASSCNTSDQFILGLPSNIKQILIEKFSDITSFIPVLHVLTERQAAYILQRDLVHIEFALDHSIFIGQQGQVNRREIELEFKSGSQTEFLSFAAQMQKKFNLQPSVDSKYAFGIKAVVSGL